MAIRAVAVAIVALASLAACETAEGYRQQMGEWQGRAGDDLLIAWGPPDARTDLSDGRVMWSYDRSVVFETAGYYRDETREVSRTLTDRDGMQRTETITESFPVWQPPTSSQSPCATRFVLSSALRVEQVSFDGGACIAAERND
ncbi:MAG: hypothetical protein SGJ21_02025 [Alphaproteobacteria bacterium]|nr:hypothetical protein [Alphaproteobacteria bacterium]